MPTINGFQTFRNDNRNSNKSESKSKFTEKTEWFINSVESAIPSLPTNGESHIHADLKKDCWIVSRGGLAGTLTGNNVAPNKHLDTYRGITYTQAKVANTSSNNEKSSNELISYALNCILENNSASQTQKNHAIIILKNMANVRYLLTNKANSTKGREDIEKCFESIAKSCNELYDSFPQLTLLNIQCFIHRPSFFGSQMPTQLKNILTCNSNSIKVDSVEIQRWLNQQNIDSGLEDISRSPQSDMLPQSNIEEETKDDKFKSEVLIEETKFNNIFLPAPNDFQLEEKTGENVIITDISKSSTKKIGFLSNEKFFNDYDENIKNNQLSIRQISHMSKHYEKKHGIKIHVTTKTVEGQKRLIGKKQLTLRSIVLDMQSVMKPLSAFIVSHFYKVHPENNMFIDYENYKGHSELIIMNSASHFIIPIYHRTQDRAITELPSDKVFISRLSCFYNPLFPLYPQGDNYSCSTLSLIYAKELLKNDGMQLKEFSLKLRFYDNNDNEAVGFFVPPPSVLRYSQSSKYNEDIKNLFNEQKSDNQIMTLYSLVDKATVVHEDGTETILTLQYLSEFKQKWMVEYDKMKGKRVMMDRDISGKKRNAYLAHRGNRLNEITNELS